MRKHQGHIVEKMKKNAFLALMLVSTSALLLLSSCHNNRTNGNLIGRWMNDSIEETVRKTKVESFSDDGTWLSISKIKGKYLEMETRSKGIYERRGDSLFINCISSTLNGNDIGGSFVVRHLIEVSDTILEYEVKGHVIRLKRVDDTGSF